MQVRGDVFSALHVAVDSQHLKRENVLACRTDVFDAALLADLLERDGEQILVSVGVSAKPRPRIVEVVIRHQHAVEALVHHPGRRRHVRQCIFPREHILKRAQTVEDQSLIPLLLLIVRPVILNLRQNIHRYPQYIFSRPQAQKPRRVCAAHGANNLNRFPPRHARGGKHFSARKRTRLRRVRCRRLQSYSKKRPKGRFFEIIITSCNRFPSSACGSSERR